MTETHAPRRIQRKRTEGWRKPENTVCIGRPGVFGNPFSDAAEPVEARVKRFAVWLSPEGESRWPNLAARRAELLRRLPELRGEDLACWCKEGAEFCHSDVLLRLANA